MQARIHGIFQNERVYQHTTKKHTHYHKGSPFGLTEKSYFQGNFHNWKYIFYRTGFPGSVTFT